MIRFRRTTAGVAMAIALVAALPVVALAGPQARVNAATAHPSGFVWGVLSSVSPTQGTIVQPGTGPVTVTFGTKATFTARNITAALKGFNTGVHVTAYGTTGTDGVKVTTVTYDVAAFPARGLRLSGGFISLAGPNLTLATPAGHILVKVRPNTHFSVHGLRATALPHVDLNQNLTVIGQQFTNGQILAKLILVG